MSIDQHLAHLEQGRYSPGTIRERSRLLATLPGNPLTMTRDEILAWWTTRQTTIDGEPKAERSLSAEASHLRAYGRWAIQQGLADRNPADWLPRIRLPQTMARPVSEADLNRLLNAAEGSTRAMIVLGALAGLRSAEIAAVNWSDIDRDTGVLWVREGKGKKDRGVVLSAGLLAELGDPGDGRIIGREITGKAVSEIVKRFMTGQGVEGTAHKLRARYVTRFLAATGDLKAAADAVGHASVTTTAMYAVASSDTMRRGAEAAGRIG